MRTLLAVPELFHSEGGISRIMRLYLRALCESARNGDRVDYVALLDEPADAARADAIANGALGMRVGCNQSKLGFIRRVLRLGIGADRAICGHLHQLAVLWFLRILRPGAKYYLVAHGIEAWRPYSWIEKRALRGAERVFCISEYTRRQLMRFDPELDPARLVIVPNSYDPGFGGNGQEQGIGRMSAAGPQSSGSSTEPRVLCVSRLASSDPYKGVDLVIEAMPAVRREFPGATLRIVGGGDDMPRLQALAEGLGLKPRQLSSVSGHSSLVKGEAGQLSNDQRPMTNDQDSAAGVVFTGAVSDEELRREYESCDIFALPSRKEGFGLVYLEAMSYGKPCIAARAGGAPEVVGDADWKAESGKRKAEDPSQDSPGSDPQRSAFRSQPSVSARQVSAGVGYTSVGALVEYGNVEQVALAVADLVRHPRDPGAMRRRAEEYAFPAFKRRLATALEGVEEKKAET